MKVSRARGQIDSIFLLINEHTRTSTKFFHSFQVHLTLIKRSMREKEHIIRKQEVGNGRGTLPTGTGAHSREAT